MRLLDEILEAKNEFLQEQWDEYLIGSWRAKPNSTMSFLKFKFITENKIHEVDFYKLKRVPKFDRHHRCRVTRFIAAYLPALNDALWGNTKTLDQLKEICKKSKLLGAPVDYEKATKEFQERAKDQRNYRKSIIEQDGFQKLKESTNRSNWEAAKR